MNPAQSMQSQLWCKATLQYPTVNQLPLESVGDMLTKAANLVATANFQWSYIDKPADGSIYLVYMQPNTPAPPDGFMYMDNEQPYTMNIQGKMIEIWEHKYGFIPGQEAVTSRSRRRFRLGGKATNDITASIWLLFYSRTDESTRVQANPMQARPQPIRKYPLPTANTKTFNLFQALSGSAAMPNHAQQMQQQYQMQQMQLQAQQALKQARAPIQALPRQYPSHMPPGRVVPPQAAYQQGIQSVQKRPFQQLPPQIMQQMRPGEVIEPVFDEPTIDEEDLLTPRDVAKTRYTRHHDWMEEILSAYPTSKIVPPPMTTSSVDMDDLKQRIEQSTSEIATMTAEHRQALAAITSPESSLQQAIITALQDGSESEVPLRIIPYEQSRKIVI